MFKYPLLGRRAVPLFASAAIVALTYASPVRAQADLFNEWDIPSLDPLTNSFGPTGLEFDFLGNATGCIPVQLSNVSLTNPWFAYTQWPIYGGGTSNPITIHYNANTNLTRVIMSGHKLPVPAPYDTGHGGTFPGPTWGNATGVTSYHVGLNQGFGAACVNNPLVRKRWIWTGATGGSSGSITTQYQDIWVAGATWTGAAQNKGHAKVTNEAVIYVENTTQNNGAWTTVSYGPAAKGQVTTLALTNNGAADITLGNAGIVVGLPLPTDPRCRKMPTCKENQQMLDELNDTYFPVNSPNSPLTPLPQLDGVTLAPGQSVDIPIE